MSFQKVCYLDENKTYMELHLPTEEKERFALTCQLLIEVLARQKTFETFIMTEYINQNKLTEEFVKDEWNRSYSENIISTIEKINNKFGKGFNPDSLIDGVLK